MIAALTLLLVFQLIGEIIARGLGLPIPGPVIGMMLLFLGVALLLSTAFVVLPMVASRFTGAHQPTPEKLTEYECGFPAFEDARAQFDVRFYLVAILFIIFDLEAAFLFPWAVSLREVGMTGFVAVLIFLGILLVGFVYEWKKGALDWE